MAYQGTKTAEALLTRSRVKTWFMVQFKGYEVVERREMPKVTANGRLTYDCLWQLRPQDASNSGGQEGRIMKETG